MKCGLIYVQPKLSWAHFADIVEYVLPAETCRFAIFVCLSVTHLSLTQSWNVVDSSYFHRDWLSLTVAKSNVILSSKGQRSRSPERKCKNRFSCISSWSFRLYMYCISNRDQNDPRIILYYCEIHFTSDNALLLRYLSVTFLLTQNWNVVESLLYGEVVTYPI